MKWRKKFIDHEHRKANELSERVDISARPIYRFQNLRRLSQINPEREITVWVKFAHHSITWRTSFDNCKDSKESNSGQGICTAHHSFEKESVFSRAIFSLFWPLSIILYCAVSNQTQEVTLINTMHSMTLSIIKELEFAHSFIST